ncbi:38250_t:CDS:2, partial [Gigaspora margarita]
MSHFVNTETLDELELESDKIEGSDKSFLLLEDNMKVTISFLETDKESRAISFRLPQMHPYEVLSITPMVGHSSKGPAQKIVKIKGGIQIQVPEFINL